MSLQFIIDGYNIIKHSRFIQLTHKKSPDAKSALIEFIKFNKLCGSKNNSVLIVFDGYPDVSYHNSAEELEVIFSRDESADSRIKKIVEKAKNPVILW